MIFKARIDRLASNKIDAIDDLIRDAIADVNQQVYQALTDEGGEFGTPVASGEAISSWWVQVNGSPASHPSPPARNQRGSYSPDLAIFKAASGGMLSIVNDSPYIQLLEDGYSSQNSGMVARLSNLYDDLLNASILLRGSKL